MEPLFALDEVAEMLDAPLDEVTRLALTGEHSGSKRGFLPSEVERLVQRFPDLPGPKAAVRPTES